MLNSLKKRRNPRLTAFTRSVTALTPEPWRHGPPSGPPAPSLTGSGSHAARHPGQHVSISSPPSPTSPLLSAPRFVSGTQRRALRLALGSLGTLREGQAEAPRVVPSPTGLLSSLQGGHCALDPQHGAPEIQTRLREERSSRRWCINTESASNPLPSGAATLEGASQVLAKRGNVERPPATRPRRQRVPLRPERPLCAHTSAWMGLLVTCV